MIPPRFWMMVCTVLLAAMSTLAGIALVTHRTERCVTMILAQQPYAAAWEVIQGCQRKP